MNIASFPYLQIYDISQNLTICRLELFYLARTQIIYYYQISSGFKIFLLFMESSSM